jgi:hypothetical protein
MGDGVDGTEVGWTRYYAKSSPLLQRDLWVFADESFTEPVLSVVGEKRAAEIADASGSVVMKAHMKGVTLSHFEYTDADDALAGTLKIHSALSKKYMEFTLTDGRVWTVVKDTGVKQSYAVLDDDVPIVKVNLTTLALKRNYPVDIADGVDLPLALGLVWAINFAVLRKMGAAGAVAAV